MGIIRPGLYQTYTRVHALPQPDGSASSNVMFPARRLPFGRSALVLYGCQCARRLSLVIARLCDRSTALSSIAFATGTTASHVHRFPGGRRCVDRPYALAARLGEHFIGSKLSPFRTRIRRPRAPSPRPCPERRARPPIVTNGPRAPVRLTGHMHLTRAYQKSRFQRVLIPSSATSTQPSVSSCDRRSESTA